MKSNIWLLKFNELNEANDNDSILYDNVIRYINEKLVVHKKTIWSNFTQLNETLLTDLTTFGSNMVTDAVVRQDDIPNGIVSTANQFEMLVIGLKIGGNDYDNRSIYNNPHAFNVEFENNKIYLTQCLQFAHVNNNILQTEMKKYFKNSVNSHACKYLRGNVKRYEDCVQQLLLLSEFGSYSFPTAAQINDYMSFSVVFHNINSLLNVLNTFISDINNNKIECLAPNGLLRVVNGYKNIKTQWRSFKDAEYCDIRLHLIYKSARDDHDHMHGHHDKNDHDHDSKNTQNMIIEARFVLDLVLDSKNSWDELHSMLKQSESINRIANQVYNIDDNYSKYKSKISKFITIGDAINLTKELFWKPNIVLSILHLDRGVSSPGRFKPLFVPVASQFGASDVEFLLLFFNCLLHLGLVLLNEQPNTDKNAFLKKYFNFNNLHGKIVSKKWFFGIDANLLDSPKSIQYEIVENMMKQSYFQGLSQMRELWVCFITFMICLIFQYFRYTYALFLVWFNAHHTT